MHTLAEYEAAKAELEALHRQWESYSGNSPDKYRASTNTARANVHLIESSLKATGQLQRSPKEELNQLLDLAFPNAASRQIVEYQGKRYVKRFTPIGKSLSGKTVKAWNAFWDEVAS